MLVSRLPIKVSIFSLMRFVPQGASAFLTSGHPALGQIGQDVKRH
jgi:hypothetical protein